jgi:non-specific serine/threonine protein kinase
VVERPVLDELSDELRGQEVLLVLDNLEQVTEAAGTIAQLLVRCSGLTVLATSREVLHVRAERVVHISPLSAPR